MRQLDEHEEPPVFYCKSDTLNIRIPYSPDYSVKFVKQMLTERTGQEPGEQWLTFGGKPLEDGFTLRDYNIQKESTIFETQGLLGGMVKRKADDDSEKLRRVAEWSNDVEEATKLIDTNFGPTLQLVSNASTKVAYMKGQQDPKAVFRECVSQVSDVQLTELKETFIDAHSDQKVEAVSEYLMRIHSPELFKALDTLTATARSVNSTFGMRLVEAFMDNRGRMPWKSIESELDAEAELRNRLAKRS